jgi:hypothetical protein
MVRRDAEGRVSLSGDAIEALRRVKAVYPELKIELKVAWSNSAKFSHFDDQRRPPARAVNLPQIEIT